MRLLRRGSWRPLAAVVVAVGLLLAGAWYAMPRDSTGAASAQEATATVTPTEPATVRPGPPPPSARRTMGEVIAITPDPASFTLRMQGGEEMTFRVLDATVFMAGRDRPYNFGLLKVGDQVGVRAGGPGKKLGAGSATPGLESAAPAKPGAGQGKRARPTGQGGQADGEPVARQVLVRPAGEPARGELGRTAGQPGGGKKGASNGIGQ